MSNDTQTLPLSDFLLARIAEDELAATRAKSHCPEPWQRSEPDHSSIAGHLGASDGTVVAYTAPARQVYFARMSPARVLAECEAKREMVETLEIGIAMSGDPANRETCRWFLTTMARVYFDHPDYREEWKP